MVDLSSKLIGLWIVLLATTLRMIQLPRPFVGGHDWQVAFYALLGSGRMLQTYPRHPPLPWLISGASISVFGQHEWAARLPPVILSVLSVGLVYVLAREFFGWREATAAGFFLAIMPVHAYYGRLETFGAFLIMFVYFSYKWSKARQVPYLVGSLAALTVGFLFDYTVLVGMIPLFYLVYRNRDWRGFAVMLAAALGMLGSWVFYLQYSGNLQDVMMVPSQDNFLWFLVNGNAVLFVTVEAYRILTLIGIGVMILTIIWIAFILLDRDKKESHVTVFMWVLGYGLFLVAFPVHTLLHDMFLLEMAPPLAVAGGAAFVFLLRRTPTIRFKRAFPLGRILAVLLLILVVVQAGATLNTYMNFKDEVPYEVGMYLREVTRVGDIVIAVTPMEIYYSGRNGYLWSYFTQATNMQEFERILATNRAAVVVPSLWKPPESTLLQAWVPSNTTEILQAHGYSLVKTVEYPLGQFTYQLWLLG